MTDPIDIADDGPADIAWMRNLAQEGANAPLQGGDILLAAGLCFGAASLIQWAVLSDLTPWSPSTLAFIWPIVTLVFVAFATTQGFRKKRQGGIRTAANRASAAVWSSVGIGIFMLFISIAVIGWKLGGTAGPIVLSLAPSIVMVFYGLGWAVSATMMRSSFMWRLSVASFVAAPVLAAFTGSSFQYLAYALALFALMALPGFLLMRAAKAARSPAV